MKRKILWAFLIIWLILTAYLLFLSNKWASAATPSYAASSAVTTDNFAELLRETLQKNPDLLLSVLRENSEAVLDIAQEGSNQRRHKSLIAQWKAELNQPKEVDIKDRPFRGAADAPVTIVAYSDFTCPYCYPLRGKGPQGKSGQDQIRLQALPAGNHRRRPPRRRIPRRRRPSGSGTGVEVL